MSEPYLTAPVASKEMPKGIPYIVTNEAAERFSYYGMKTILVIFMTRYLMGEGGGVDPMSDAEAKTYYHLFSMGVYFFPIIGALVSDALWGKYKTILWVSIVYCLGHLALALDETRLGLGLGLTLIAIGSGGIKPCVSAHVGDQFGASNQHLMEKVFSWFYFAINLGAFVSTLLTPVLLDQYGPSVAFGVPGGLMLVATWLFWLGRNKFVHIPPSGKASIKEIFSREGLGVMKKLASIYVFVAVFWSLYDQTGSAWVLQAQNMDRMFLGIEWLPSQIQAANPILIMVFIPIFSLWIYPAIDKVYVLNPLRKIGIGFFLCVGSFAISAVIEQMITAGGQPNIIWQVLAYVVITASEVMVSITCLEFSYKQAPKSMKSFIMSLYLLSVSAGNLLTSLVNSFIQNEDGSSKLEGASYYWFFAGLMLVAAVAYIAVAKRYKEHTYIQEETADGTEPEAA
jgi:POT family proton-dependent oligopeptide transporter